MKSEIRNFLLWLVVLGAFFGALWLCRPAEPLSSPKGAELFPAVHPRTANTPAQPVPLVIVPPDSSYTVYYFAATARDTNGLESDYSNEVTATNYTSNAWATVSLAWDRSPGTNIITNYSVYFGGSHTNYTNIMLVGTNLTATVRPVPLPPTNLVLTVTTTGTNIYRAASLKGPWTSLGRTNYVATNPPAPAFFRGRGKAGNRVTISSKLQ